MSDYFASENYIDTEEKMAWYCREKSIPEKIKEFFFGRETVDHHFEKAELADFDRKGTE